MGPAYPAGPQPVESVDPLQNRVRLDMGLWLQGAPETVRLVLGQILTESRRLTAV